MNGESQDDESDRDHAQEGQEPVGQSMKSLVTRGRQKEKKCGSKPYGPTVHCRVTSIVVGRGEIILWTSTQQSNEGKEEGKGLHDACLRF